MLWFYDEIIGGYVRILQMFLILCTQFPATVMVLGVVSNEGHVSPLLSSKTSGECCCLHEVLEAVVKPWIDSVRGERPYVFQQNSAPSHKAMTKQKWPFCFNVE